MAAGMAMLLFWLYAAVMGLSLGGIFLVFTGESIARVCFITAGDLRRDEGDVSRVRHRRDRRQEGHSRRAASLP
jgi:hypothetical protein